MDKNKRIWTRKKIVMMVISLFLVLTISVPTAIHAFFFSLSVDANDYIIGQNSISSVNEIGEQVLYSAEDVVPYTVSASNTGSVDAYVRIKAVFANSDIEQTYLPDWNYQDYDYNNGYYYLINMLRVGETAPALITSMTVQQGIEEGVQPEMIVYTESVPAAGYDSYTSAWAAYTK